MKLLLSNNQLTRYARSGEYATTTSIPLDGELAITAQTLLAWLQAQLTEGESVGQVFLSQTARTATTRRKWTPKASNHRL
jgi:hypothetical protein